MYYDNEEENDIILDFSTIDEEKVEIPDLKNDPDKTIDLTQVVEAVKEESNNE